MPSDPQTLISHGTEPRVWVSALSPNRQTQGSCGTSNLTAQTGDHTDGTSNHTDRTSKSTGGTIKRSSRLRFVY